MSPEKLEAARQEANSLAQLELTKLDTQWLQVGKRGSGREGREGRR